MKQLKKPMSKKGTLAMSLATAGILTLGTLGTALADAPNQDTAQASGERRGIFGSVTAKGEHTLTLLGRGGETLVLTVNDQTKFRIPGDADPSFSDVVTGSRVAALVRREAGGLVALQVMPMPGQPQREHRVLTVVDVAGKTLTAQDAQGHQITVELDQEVSPDLKGQLAIFIGERSQQSNRFKANAEVKIDRVVERLEANAARLHKEADAETDDAGKASKERQVARLEERLQTNRQRHLDRLDAVITKAPENAKGPLKMPLERFKKQYRAHAGDMEKPLDQPEGLPRPDALGVKPGPRAVQGVVQAVDASASKLTLLTLDGTVTTMDITDEADVRVGDRTVPISDLAAGARVTVHYYWERSAVDGVQVKNDDRTVVKGTIKAVDASANTITIATRDGEEHTFTLSPSARVTIKGAAGGLADLKAGMDIVVEHGVSGVEIIQLTVGPVDGPSTKTSPPAPPMERERGDGVRGRR